MAQRGARPSIPFRRHPNFALDGIGRRLFRSLGCAPRSSVLSRMPFRNTTMHTSVLRAKRRALAESRLAETSPVAERGQQKPAQSLSEHYIQIPCPVT